MSMKKEEKRAAFSLAPWKRLWQSIRQHRVRLTVAIVKIGRASCRERV